MHTQQQNVIDFAQGSYLRITSELKPEVGNIQFSWWIRGKEGGIIDDDFVRPTHHTTSPSTTTDNSPSLACPPKTTSQPPTTEPKTTHPFRALHKSPTQPQNNNTGAGPSCVLLVDQGPRRLPGLRAAPPALRSGAWRVCMYVVRVGRTDGWTRGISCWWHGAECVAGVVCSF